jgi:uncharacterized protein (TIRG00374 family)
MQPAVKKWLKFTLRWGIAVVGVWFVVKNISLHDTVRMQDPADGRPVTVRLAEPARSEDQQFVVYDPHDSTQTLSVPREKLVARSQFDRLQILTEDGSKKTVDVLGLKVPADPETRVNHWPLLVSEPRSLLQRFLGRMEGAAWTVSPLRVVGGGYKQDVLSYPLVDDGLVNVVKRADHSYLLAALLIFPLNYVITSFRWKRLLSALEIPIGAARAFHINMVGAFYNTFMPGSTGGDLLKAYYAAKHTHHKTRAVLSVVVDRIIGLVALILLGGTMATIKALASGDWHDPVTRKCLQVAIGSAAILVFTVIALTIYYVPVLRRLSGLTFLLAKLPMQKQVRSAIDVMDLYGRQPLLVLMTLLISLPVHAITVVSAMLAGQAFGLPIRPEYYWVVVPVVTLAGAIPVSPQGAGVMEFFAYLLMRGQKATVADALVLTMSIRFVQIFWNLLAGIFVLRGGYHAPTVKEAQTLQEDSDDGGGPGAVLAAKAT